VKSLEHHHGLSLSAAITAANEIRNESPIRIIADINTLPEKEKLNNWSLSYMLLVEKFGSK